MTEIKKTSEYRNRLVPVKLYYTAASGYPRVRLTPERAEKLISENSAIPVRIYRDRLGNTLCIKSGRRYSKEMSSYIVVKKRGRDEYKIYFPPDISELTNGYDHESHKIRFMMKFSSDNQTDSFISQIELARALNLPLSNTKTVFKKSMAVQQFLDKLAELMDFEEIENPIMIDTKTGRKYFRDDL